MAKKKIAKKTKSPKKTVKKSVEQTKLIAIDLIDLDNKKLGAATIDLETWTSLNKPKALVPAHFVEDRDSLEN